MAKVIKVDMSRPMRAKTGRPMRMLKENADEEWVDYISDDGPDAVVLSHTGAAYRRWVRDGRPPMMQTGELGA